MILLWIAILLFSCYSVLLLYYWYAWKSQPEFSVSGKSAQLKLSVIIPARNEEKNIGRLLQAIEKQTYPRQLFEVIVVDDHSTDQTASIVRGFSFVKLLTLTEDPVNSYKKKAIETGIAASTGELILTTDADCEPPPGWLQTIAIFKEETRAVFIAAPVVYENNYSLIQVFQALDFLSLQGITGAAVNKNLHAMCNGANLAYERKVFDEVGGFSGVEDIASGDDMLLMYKIWKKYPRLVYYLKSKQAIVSTLPIKTWKEFFNQRIRWASKATRYDDKSIMAVLGLVYLFNLSFLAFLTAGFFDCGLGLYLFIFWIAKTAVELPLMFSVAPFFNKKSLLVYFFLMQPLHIAYTILAGLWGLMGRYEWKGRRVR